jgi:RNA polymerase sigma-70 factor (ECF subfamily)
MVDVQTAAEAVFREDSGRIIATLIRISGSFDRAEEAMQEAFASALASWPDKGIPRNPGAGITAAAHRKLIDQSRRERTKPRKAGFAALRNRHAPIAGRSGTRRDRHAFS